MNKRTFLQRLASTVAAIALAPALCRGIGRLEVEQEPAPAVNLFHVEITNYDDSKCIHVKCEWANISTHISPGQTLEFDSPNYGWDMENNGAYYHVHEERNDEWNSYRNVTFRPGINGDWSIPRIDL